MRARIDLKMRRGAKKNRILLLLLPLPFLHLSPRIPLKKEGAKD